MSGQGAGLSRSSSDEVRAPQGSGVTPLLTHGWFSLEGPYEDVRCIIFLRPCFLFLPSKVRSGYRGRLSEHWYVKAIMPLGYRRMHRCDVFSNLCRSAAKCCCVTFLSKGQKDGLQICTSSSQVAAPFPSFDFKALG